MPCNLCGKHNASIFFKGIVNDQAIKLHLCEACARKKGMVFPFGKSIESLSAMVTGLAQSSKAANTLYGTCCTTCGLTYAEFKQTSQLGCSQCYATFAPLIGPLLKRIHGSAQHVGKTYKRTVRPGSIMEELAQLKVELRDAVRKEDFEKAAELRDQIRRVESDRSVRER